MALSVHKFNNIRPETVPGLTTKIADVVLDDGVTKKTILLGGLPDDTAQATSTVLGRPDIQSLFDQAQTFDESVPNIDSPDKTIKGKDYGRLKADAASAVSVPALRAVVEELVEAVEALKDKTA